MSLADRANKENECFPSVARVCEDTCLDRKTVLNTINDLISLGIISDTGDRKGATRQVRVLKINIVSVDNLTDKQCEISEVTVVNLHDNGGKIPSNSGKFGTRNLKQSNLES
ncbi:MAG: helix-turn-helix domain-containing protein, partial [Cellulosilyticaceae bacterium]